MRSNQVNLTEDTFGEFKDRDGKVKKVRRFTWKNQKQMSVQVITYGGYITSVVVPDASGKPEDVVLGFDTLDGYLQPGNRYFGATVGRVANRIAQAEMTVDGVRYKLAANSGPHHLHGGVRGFDKVLWEACVRGTRVVLSYHSADMEEGYPGDVVVNVAFELTEDSEFRIEYRATTTKPTPVNLTNHSYFNLAGDGRGAVELYEHVVCINADKITEVADGVPTGNLLNVSGTVFDLRVPKTLGDVIHKVPNSPGYDHNFCITRGMIQELAFVASAYHPDSGRTMEVYSDQPGVQFYTGNFLPDDRSLIGKRGGNVTKHGAFCLETQNFPDAVNQKGFPKIILYPGEEYHHTAIYRFFVR